MLSNGTGILEILEQIGIVQRKTVIDESRWEEKESSRGRDTSYMPLCVPSSFPWIVGSGRGETQSHRRR